MPDCDDDELSQILLRSNLTLELRTRNFRKSDEPTNGDAKRCWAEFCEMTAHQSPQQEHPSAANDTLMKPEAVIAENASLKASVCQLTEKVNSLKFELDKLSERYREQSFVLVANQLRQLDKKLSRKWRSFKGDVSQLRGDMQMFTKNHDHEAGESIVQ